MKTCKACGESKSLESFYAHPKMKDGRLNFCIPCFRARENKRRADDPEAIRSRDRAYWAANPDKKRAKDRRYKEQHRAEAVANATAWARAHPDRYKENMFASYVRQHGGIPVCTIEQWQAKLAEYGGKCAECGSVKNITRDHIVPLSRGGTDDIANIQPLCRGCNTRKANRMRVEPSP